MEAIDTAAQTDGRSVISRRAVEAVEILLDTIGEDHTRDGLQGTPDRVVRALKEMTVGYAQDPADVLKTTFMEPCDEMILVAGIDFASLCEHHMLPFVGKATVAYVPGERVVGLSKIPRLVHCFSKRLQIQERLTNQIVDALTEHLQPLGAACLIRASHSCMAIRGVQCQAEMVTSALRGVFLDDPKCRQEFMSLAR